MSSYDESSEDQPRSYQTVSRSKPTPQPYLISEGIARRSEIYSHPSHSRLREGTRLAMRHRSRDRDRSPSRDAPDRHYDDEDEEPEVTSNAARRNRLERSSSSEDRQFPANDSRRDTKSGRRDFDEAKIDDGSSKSGRKTIVPLTGLDGGKTHQEPPSPSRATITLGASWRPQQMYNPQSIIPVYPVLSKVLGDVRDRSKARNRWVSSLELGLQENEVMERITGLFGMEDFKQHCFDLYKRLIGMQPQKRLEEIGTVDMFFTEGEGVGFDIAALRYWELLVSLEVISSPALVQYVTDEPASLASVVRLVRDIQSREANQPLDSYVFIYRRTYKGHDERGEQNNFDELRSLTRSNADASKNMRNIVWIGIGTASALEDDHGFKFPVLYVNSEPLTRVELCHGLRFLLGFGNSQSVEIEYGADGPVIERVVKHIQEGHKDRGTWQEWTTLETSARMLREIRLRPSWRESGNITMQNLAAAVRYYGKEHLLMDGLRFTESEQLKQMVGLESVKRDVVALFEMQERHHIQCLRSGRAGLPPFQRASLNRYYHGPTGSGRRIVAKLYSRILWRLGFVVGQDTFTLSLASFKGMPQRAIEKRIQSAFNNPKNVGVVIFEDAGIFSLANNDEDPAEVEDHDDSHDEHDSGIGSHKDVPRYSETRLRSVVFNILATTIEKMISRPNMPVLVMVGPSAPALHPSLTRFALGPGTTQGWVNPSRQTRHPSFRRLIPEEAQIVKLDPYTTAQLMTLFRTRLEIEIGTAASLVQLSQSKAVSSLHEVISVSQLRPSFDNVRFIHRLVAKTARAQNTAPLQFTSTGSVDDWSLQQMGPEIEIGFLNTISEGLPGLADIMFSFKSIYGVVTDLRRNKDQDPRPYAPFLFVFQGPTGSGKTSVVHGVVAPLYHVMGLLDDPEVVTCSMEQLTHPLPDVKNSDDKAKQPSLFYAALKTRVSRLLASAFGKVLHIRATSKSNVMEIYSEAKDFMAWRCRILQCITECLDGDNQTLKNKVVVVFEEDDLMIGEENYEFDLTSRHFEKLDFPGMTKTGDILRTLQANIDHLGIQIEMNLISENLVKKPVPTSAQRKANIMLRYIASRRGFCGGWELEAISNDIVWTVFNRTPGLAPKGVIVFKMEELVTLLERRYPEKPWAGNGF